MPHIQDGSQLYHLDRRLILFRRHLLPASRTAPQPLLTSYDTVIKMENRGVGGRRGKASSDAEPSGDTTGVGTKILGVIVLRV